MTGVATRDNPPVRADDSPPSSADTAASGLATSALQTSGNAILAAIQALLPTALSAGRLVVESTGNIASGVADSGNPVKVGGVRRATLPSFADGQRGDLQLGARGSLQVNLMSTDGTTGAQLVAAGDGRVAQTALEVDALGAVFDGTNWNRARGDAVGGAWVQGNVASGATDTGSPVKAGGRFNTTPPTLTNGQRGDLQVDAAANLKTTLATLIAGEDQVFDRLKTMMRFTPTNIAAATTTLVKSGAGVLHSITINTTAAGTITIYDSLTAAGTKIATIKTSVVEQTFVFDCAFATGLTIVTGAASDITVNWI
jgi:hypothetical protein